MRASATIVPDEAAYLRIADRLEEAIERRRPGSLLPSEREMARDYGINRLTARAALDELERRHLVSRRQGRGTFVAERIDYAIGLESPPSWTHTVRRGGGEPHSLTVASRAVRATRDVAAALNIRIGASVFYVARRRFLARDLAGFAESWIVGELAACVRAQLASEGSLYDAFESNRLQPVGGMRSVELQVAPPRIARELGETRRPLVFRVAGTTVARALGRPLETTVSWLRADMLRVRCEIGAVAS
jgi:DNA-binding GntR family transcriptional regulator